MTQASHTSLKLRTSGRTARRFALVCLALASLAVQRSHAFIRGRPLENDRDGDLSPPSSSSSSRDEPGGDCTLPGACRAAQERIRRSQIRELAVFGDSFSDVGNVFRASNGTQPSSPPYFRGRYSNGRNYVDFLGEALGLEVSTDSDFAWGGATTNNRLVPGFSTFLNSTVPSFQEQVRAYLAQSSAASPCEAEGDNRNDVAATTALYVVLIGYNDYWWYANQNVTDSTTNSDMEAFVDRVVSSLIEGVQDLVSGRCRGRRAVAAVGNLPPMDLLPDASSKAPPVVGAYRELTRLHNAKLADELGGLDRKAAGGARIRLFPVHEALSELVDHASCLGFGNASLACLNSKAKVCDDPYRHLFWDEWHPMTWTHQKLAGAALAAAAP